MIKTGIDLVEVKRIENIFKSTPRFIGKYFGDEEQKLFRQKGNTKAMMQTIAANFAAKEAFSKAMGTGVRDFSLNQVEILRDRLGAPYIKLSGEAEHLVKSKGLSLSVSLSHTDDYATAIVLAYN